VGLVWVDETRPLLQGARLTAWELRRLGIPYRVLPDAAAGSLLARGEVDRIVVGADRIAANGDTANKIGTDPLAVLARRHQVPFYVAAPLSTIDPATATGADIPSQAVSWIAFGLIAIGWFWKNLTWHHNGTLVGATTLNSATGLAGGEVRSIEWPHSEQNYLLKEMGYRIARKHAAKLRMAVHVLAFGVPLAATEIAILSNSWLAVAASVLAALAMIPGLLVERWLFFAEAKHTVTLYYGR
jgi:DMSO reductase anchor subunit